MQILATKKPAYAGYALFYKENWLREPDLNQPPSPVVYKELSPTSSHIAVE
ncbi:hypothetical protein [Shewanella sp.]|uniref:hypothetical protein n=1 Tax=Shewanella sp. TaxID=50422 RepID=UPI0026242943|nr:hypothetical protein [Shewanella sp.]